MTCLSIYAFGQPRAVLADETVLRFPTEKSLELLLLAAIAPSRTLGRSAAASALRSDHSETGARKALSTDLWRLRKVFDDAGLPSSDVLSTSGRTIALNPDLQVFFDAQFVEDIWDEVAEAKPETITPKLAVTMRRAVEFYTGDFAETLDQEWCFLYREKLRSKHLGLINLLLGYEAARDNWTAAVVWADRLLEQDPLLEHAHRTLMQCHFLMGNRAVAIRQYAACRDILERELGVAPSEETTRMYRGLVAVQIDEPTGKAARVQRTLTLEPPPTRAGKRLGGTERPLTDQLSMAMGSLDAARSLIANVDDRLRRVPDDPQTT